LTTRWRAFLLGTLAVGVLDLADALVFFGLRGAQPIRILQSIAAGTLGREAFTGGAATAALGVGLHFTVAAIIVAVYMGVASRVGLLARRPFVFGPAYGVVAYLVMNWVVVPLSATSPGARSGPVLVNGLLIHILGVGLPAALAAAYVRRSE
jgi:hypothetical protein